MRPPLLAILFNAANSRANLQPQSPTPITINFHSISSPRQKTSRYIPLCQINLFTLKRYKFIGSSADMPALARQILICSSTLSTPSRSGSNSPRLKPHSTITPYFLGSSWSTLRTGSGPVRTSTLYSRSSSSEAPTGINRGSCVAELMALATISPATLALVGRKVPMQPLNSPCFLIDTKTPAFDFISAVNFLGLQNLPWRIYFSTAFRANSTIGLRCFAISPSSSSTVLIQLLSHHTLQHCYSPRK